MLNLAVSTDLGLQNTELPKGKTGFGIQSEQYLQAIFQQNRERVKNSKRQNRVWHLAAEPIHIQGKGPVCR